jgi:hypothetical protein
MIRLLHDRRRAGADYGFAGFIERSVSRAPGFPRADRPFDRRSLTHVSTDDGMVVALRDGVVR